MKELKYKPLFVLAIAMILTGFLILLTGCGSKHEEPAVSTVNQLPNQVTRVSITDYCMRYQPYADTYTYSRCLTQYDDGQGYYNGGVYGRF